MTRTISKAYALATVFVLFLTTLTEAQPTTSANLQEAARLHTQAVQLFNQGNYDEALPLAKKSVEIREKELKSDDHLRAISYQNLAHIYRAKRKYDLAEKFFRLTLKVEEKRLGTDHSDLYDLIVNIAWVCHGQGNTREAEKLLKQALGIKEKHRDANHEDVVEALYYLAQYYQKIGSPEKSIPFYQRMIAAREKTFGEFSNAVKESVEQCACALQQDRKIAEADKLWERARLIDRKLKPEYEQASQGILTGYAIKKVQPAYPESARGTGTSGAVMIKVIVDKAGKVIEAKPLCGPDLLIRAAEDAARQWVFAPTKVNGQAVKVQGVLTFNFTLR